MSDEDFLHRDMLELKEIQRSLPHAAQPLNDADLPELDARGIPRTHFLNTVPVGLVPLISPTTSPTSHPESVRTPPSRPKLETPPPPPSPHSHPPPSPPSTPPPKALATNPPPSLNRRKPPSPPACKDEPWVPPPPPPRLPYNIPIQPRPVPRFQFLPLLETPEAPAQPTPVLASSGSDRAPEKCLSPLSKATSRLSQDLPRTLPAARTPSPRDEKVGSSSSSLLQLRHSPQSTPISPPSSSVGGPPTAVVRTTQGRSSNLHAAQLLPSSHLPSSPPSPGESLEEDTTHLEAELTRLWHSHSSNADGETEAEESEAESSVVHTEAESDGEYAHGLACSGRKVVRTPIVVTTAADAGDDEEGEMSLVELESGVMAFVRAPRRR
jgi:hypothetical protein